MLADLQSAIVARLTSTPGVTALVPADAIVDGYSVPTTYPLISLGEDRAASGDFISLSDSFSVDVLVPLVIHTRSSGFLLAKQIVSAVMQALLGPLTVGDQIIHLRFADCRFARGVDGLGQRATVTFRTRALEQVTA